MDDLRPGSRVGETGGRVKRRRGRTGEEVETLREREGVKGLEIRRVSLDEKDFGLEDFVSWVLMGRKKQGDKRDSGKRFRHLCLTV